jgi:signal peptidase I
MRGMVGSAHESILRTADRECPAWFPLYIDVLRDSVGQGLAVHLPVSGHSMRPTIAGGATLVVVGTARAPMRPGDIVVYEDAGRVICHRVVWRRRTPLGGELLTKGDGITLPPVWVPASAVIGRVAAIETEGVRRSLDHPCERLRAFALVARAWVGVLGRRLMRVVGALRRPARAA